MVNDEWLINNGERIIRFVGGQCVFIAHLLESVGGQRKEIAT